MGVISDQNFQNFQNGIVSKEKDFFKGTLTLAFFYFFALALSLLWQIQLKSISKYYEN